MEASQSSLSDPSVSVTREATSSNRMATTSDSSGAGAGAGVKGDVDVSSSGSQVTLELLKEFFYAKALFDFTGENHPEALPIFAGDVIQVCCVQPTGWWDGAVMPFRPDQISRGWFPSNYVERISHEEAIALLDQAGHDGWELVMSSKTVSEDYGDEGEADETGVIPISGVLGGGGEDGRMRMANGGGGIPDDVGVDGLEHQRVMSESERDAMLESVLWLGMSGSGTLDQQGSLDSPSLSTGGNVFGELAAAAAAASNSTTTAEQQEQLDNLYASVTGGRTSRKETWDYWMPRVTETGEVFYENTRTGQTSRDLPLSLGEDLESDVGEGAGPSDGAGGGGVGSSQNLYGARVDEGGDAAALSSGGSLQEWVPKLTDDRSRYYWENRRTGEIRWTPPSAASSNVSKGAYNGNSAPGYPAGNSSSNDVTPVDSRRGSDSVLLHQNESRVGNKSGGAVTRTTRSSSSPNAPRLHIPHSSTSETKDRDSAHPSSSGYAAIAESSSSQASLMAGSMSSRPGFERKVSAYSDESALDADFPQSRKGSSTGVGAGAGAGAGTRSRTKGKAPMDLETLRKRAGSTATKNSISSLTSAGRDPSASLASPQTPTLAELLERTKNALEEIQLLAQSPIPMDPTIPGGSNEGVKLANEFRTRLAVLGDDAVSEVRALMHASGVWDPNLSTSSKGSTPTVGESSSSSGVAKISLFSSLAPSEVKDPMRKITTNLSRLVLSLRASMAKMGMAAERDETEFDDMHFADNEEANEQARRKMLNMRRATSESEIKQRVELGKHAKEVLGAVVNFVDAMEKFGPQTALVTSVSSMSTSSLSKGESIRTTRHPLGYIKVNPRDLLFQEGGYGGNWRGNGFATPTINHPSSIGSKPPPSIPISAEVYARVVASGKVVEGHLGSFRGLVDSVLGKLDGLQSPKRSSATSFGSPRLRSSHSLGSIAGRATAQAFPQITSQTTELFNGLGEFLALVEDIDIASRVDVDIGVDMASALQGKRAVQSSLLDAATEEVMVSEYQSSLKQGRNYVADLKRSKQALYELSSAILFTVQSIGMPNESPFLEDGVESERNSVGFRHDIAPSMHSPLESFVIPPRPADPLIVVQAALSDVRTHVYSVGETIHKLLVLADEQAAVPADVRSSTQSGRLSYRSDILRNSFDGRPESIMTEIIPADSYKNRRPGSRGLDEENGELVRVNGDGADSDYYPSMASSVQSLSGRSTQPSYGSSTLVDARRPSVSTMKSQHSQASMSPSESSSMPYRRNTVSDVGDDLDGAASATRSPSKQKLKRIFGEELSTQSMVNRPLPPVQEGPAFLGADYSPEDLSFSLEGPVKGGTLRALVAKLTTHQGSDLTFTQTFLMTYRTFTNSAALFELLAQRFNIRPPADLTPEELQSWARDKQKLIQFRVGNVMKQWIENFFYEDDEESVLERVHEFAKNEMGDTNNARQVMQAVERRKQAGAPRRRGPQKPLGDPPPPIVPRSGRKLKFLDIDPLELARQLTIIESRLFTSIGPVECLTKAWPKLFSAEFAPNMKATVDHHVAFTTWVTETILKQEDLRKRASTIKQFIAVADKCRVLGNYSSLMHITACLNSTPVHRLKRTWETVNQKTMATFTALNGLVSPHKNFGEYREAIRNPTLPLVPFLGLYFTDWVFIGDGNPDLLREKANHINFNKRQKVAELIIQIQSFQSELYNLREVPAIQNFLQENLRSAELDQQAHWQMSLLIEPKERDDEKIARLLAESGFL